MPGQYCAAVPLSATQANDLREAAADGDLHRLCYTTVPAPEDVEDEIARRLSLLDAGSMMPLAVLDTTGKAVGMTTYMNIDQPNRRLEIGSTWYRKAMQRSPINTECKLLLLRHAL